MVSQQSSLPPSLALDLAIDPYTAPSAQHFGAFWVLDLLLESDLLGLQSFQ